jgi:hypothetical protein
MKCLVLLILVFICATVDGLLCIKRKNQLGAVLFDLEPENFETIIYNLSSIKVGDNDLCRVKFEIIIGLEFLGTISFNTDLSDSELDNNEVLYETYFFFDESDDALIVKNLEYACSEDDCDKQFIVDHIGWFFPIIHEELAWNITQLIKDDNKEPGNNFKIIIEKKSFIFKALVKIF